MKKVLQLKIDIKTDKVTQELYDSICVLIKLHGGEVMDDGHAPYVEDMTEEYDYQFGNMN